MDGGAGGKGVDRDAQRSEREGRFGLVVVAGNDQFKASRQVFRLVVVRGGIFVSVSLAGLAGQFMYNVVPVQCVFF